MTGPRYTPLAASLPASVPFVGPEAQERKRGEEFIARLGANESVFGPSPNAIKAMEQAASDTWMYGDPESHDLRNALASHENCAPENIIIGEGHIGSAGDHLKAGIYHTRYLFLGNEAGSGTGGKDFCRKVPDPLIHFIKGDEDISICY